MKEPNELTRRLLADGWKPEDTPPGTCPYADYYGGWTYTVEALRNTVWETPCGLLAKGGRFINGYMSYGGIDWRPENGNPVVACPAFASESCPLRDPRLDSERYCCSPDDVVRQCACHQTNRPYTYEGSVDEAHDRVWKEAGELWEVFAAEHGGRVCRHQSRYGRTAKAWQAFYDPTACPGMGCSYCDILAKDIDSRKGNVFYDLRKSWTEKGAGFFPDERRTAIEKGCKLLDRTASLTICEAIAKYGRRSIEQRVRSRYHREMFFDKTLEIEILNVRAARVDARDILQDLRDIADGIEVIHAADSLKAAAEQKRARRAAAKARKVRKIEKIILDSGWNGLDAYWKRKAEKLLDEERIGELDKCHAAAQSGPAQPAMEQLCIRRNTGRTSWRICPRRTLDRHENPESAKRGTARGPSLVYYN